MTGISDILHLLTTADLWHATLAAAILLLLPALGGVISERSGVVNIAMEGMMLTGAFFAVVADLAWHNPWLAALVAMVAGGLMALIHAVVSIRFRADQIVSGIAINIFAAGLTLYLVNRIYGIEDVGHVGQSALLPSIDIPIIDQIPFVGHVFSNQNVVVYVALILLVVIQIVLFRTRLGLRIRAVGEHPQAADTAGINVYAIRYGAVITSGLLSGLSGAFLAIGVSNTFVPNMTDGRGYIALAAVIFGKWRPLGAFVACLIFGLGQAIYDNNSFIHISQYFLSMLPYILTLIVLAGVVGRSIPPAADGIPYSPGTE
ncbi:MAG: branched-chain amino acid ABC transporter permease [Chloroflexi bacterium 13_1_40CM_3_65_12]|nr:MAG: branched-chain amino acid ABC transporter permease [Chloroflexi bacterium 13_1_40CM_65_17]OLD24280.1 MAG: branched-chain amino acid ABC transporter permease [Chloroflexi bacterium 13_1_40CM_3_65_12]